MLFLGMEGIMQTLDLRKEIIMSGGASDYKQHSIMSNVLTGCFRTMTGKIHSVVMPLLAGFVMNRFWHFRITRPVQIDKKGAGL